MPSVSNRSNWHCSVPTNPSGVTVLWRLPARRSLPIGGLTGRLRVSRLRRSFALPRGGFRLSRREARAGGSKARRSVRAYYAGLCGSTWDCLESTTGIFEGESGAQLARAAVARLRYGVFVESVKTSAPIYERGAAADIVVHANNTSHEPRSVDIALELLGLPKNAGPAHLTSLSQPAEMPGQSEQTFQFSFQIPEDAPDFIQAVSDVKDGSVLADRAVSGFCVRDGGVIAAGPRIHYAGNVLIVQNRTWPSSECVYSARTRTGACSVRRIVPRGRGFRTSR